MSSPHPMTREQVLTNIIPALHDAINRPPLLGTKTRLILDNVSGMAQTMGEDGVTTAGKIINNVLYPTKGSKPRRPSSIGGRLYCTCRDINELLKRAKLPFTLQTNSISRKGMARKFYFEESEQPVAMPQATLPEVNILSKELAASALAHVITTPPKDKVLPRKTLRHMYSIISILDEESSVTTVGEIIKKVFHSPPSKTTKRKVREQIRRTTNLINTLFQSAKLPLMVVLEDTRNADDKRLLYFEGHLPDNCLRLESELVPHTPEQAAFCFHKVVEKYRP